MEIIILILLAGIIAALAWQIRRVRSETCGEPPLCDNGISPNTAKWYGMYIMRCGIWRRNRRKRRMRVKCRE